ncbi:MAG: hypothetical protein AAFX93_13370 [Verrucomicrobiota bacterium]
MSSVASKHPFPVVSRESDVILPVLLAPSLYVITSYAVFWGSGSVLLQSPNIILLVGLLSVLVGARMIFRRNSSEPRDRQICSFIALVMLIYLQLLLPRLWG